MRKVSNFGLLALGAAFFVAACDQAPTNPANDGPDVSAAVLEDDAASADGAAEFEFLELCKEWVGGAPFATTFQITASTPGGAQNVSQNVTIDGTEVTPGCKVVLKFDGTSDNFEPATNISIVEAPPPANWAVTDIDDDIVLRNGSDGSEIGEATNLGTRTWSASLLNNDHGVLVTFENTFTPPPPPGGEGCTPGFWKNHLADWSATGYATADLFDTVFGVSSTFGDTLLEALIRDGGKDIALNRHAVAALLNAASPNVAYDLTEAEVIQLVQDAYAADTNDAYESAKKVLEDLNKLHAPGFCN